MHLHHETGCIRRQGYVTGTCKKGLFHHLAEGQSSKEGIHKADTRQPQAATTMTAQAARCGGWRRWCLDLQLIETHPSTSRFTRLYKPAWIMVTADAGPPDNDCAVSAEPNLNRRGDVQGEVTDDGVLEEDEGVE